MADLHLYDPKRAPSPLGAGDAKTDWAPGDVLAVELGEAR